jgi:hypothetical protein
MRTLQRGSMVDTKFVVYGFLRGDYGSFYYIGKGRPYRPYQKTKRTIPHPGCNSRVVIIYENIPEVLALDNERRLIALMGRIGIDEGGVLRNRNPGGEGVSRKHSAELRQQRELYKIEKIRSERRNWIHLVSGIVKNHSHRELSKLYPEQKLSHHELKKVANGTKKYYKGWTLEESGVLPTFTTAKRHDWYHENYGEIYQKTIREVMQFDNRHYLNVESLRGVVRGKIISHKGWKLLKNKDVDTRRRDTSVHDWYHEVYGLILQTGIWHMHETYKVPLKGIKAVAKGYKFSCMGWKLVENKDRKIDNQEKKESWEHEVYGVVENCSAGGLKEMFPDQGLITTMLRGVARRQRGNHKGWFLKGKLIVKEREPAGNWYNPEYGSFFGKTPSEMAKVDKRDVVRPHMFFKLLDGRSRMLRGWLALKKCERSKTKAYKPVESKLAPV